MAAGTKSGVEAILQNCLDATNQAIFVSSVSGSPVLVKNSGYAYVDSASIDSSSANITTAADSTLIASTAGASRMMIISNATANPLTLKLGTAVSGIIPAGAILTLELTIAASTAIKLRALGATSSSGYVTISLYN